MGVALMKPDTKIIEREITGDVRITESSQYNNMNADHVIVAEGITVRLFGVVHKKLTIGKGARVHLHGTMAGVVEDNGGELYKY